MLAVPERDVLRGGRRSLVPQALALRAPHARVAKRVKRVRVLDVRVVAMQRVRGRLHEGPLREPCAVAEHDVLRGRPEQRHYTSPVTGCGQCGAWKNTGMRVSGYQARCRDSGGSPSACYRASTCSPSPCLSIRRPMSSLLPLPGRPAGPRDPLRGDRGDKRGSEARFARSVHRIEVVDTMTRLTLTELPDAW